MVKTFHETAFPVVFINHRSLLKTQPCFFSNLNYNLDIYLNLPPTGEIMSSSFLRIFSKYREKQEKKKEREEFMIRNGGIVLKEVIASSHGKYNPIRIFSAEELETATKNFSRFNLVKEDLDYMLYKGVLQEYSISVMNFDDNYNTLETFQCCINNIAFACQMRHKNVLRLTGCCLETQTPIPVFESVEYGTLADHIVRYSERFEALSWTLRLKIAMQVADAVAYLHVGFARPIVSRNIKLSNVLLDEEYVAKLSDFTLSAFILEGETHTDDGVKGTVGYITPEYTKTRHFNETCDVYSFGIVLLQLLTGRPALELEADRYDLILSYHVIRYNEDNRINEMIDPIIVGDGLCPQKEQQLKAFTELALKCVSEAAQDRPTIVDVAKQLRQMYVASM